MRLGVIADVHANLAALEAVLAALPPVDGLVCAGDIVGYGPQPAACVDALRSWGDGDRDLLAIRGNHDRAVTAGVDPDDGMAGAGVRHARAELGADALAWLADLPPGLTGHGDCLRVAHGHPADPDRYVYPSLFDRSLLADERVLVLGHTHIQARERFEQAGWARVRRRVVLNPGSVGQPRDGEPTAAYATLTLDPEPAVALHRVDYDVERTVRAIRDAGLPAAAGERLRKGV
ncbi:metallophosphoesterase [Haloglomus irregulare]|uniref:Metallophosphoesterase n=1 Tax=Haloglomus irregulare TaxID=2234134 RepID=A0A554NFF1_9EURY|nr:metallophosphoesterase family protein [Haloglomus irregulare]TSD16116.1 metallophosphoesterase [Haloglomus irregulare]